MFCFFYWFILFIYVFIWGGGGRHSWEKLRNKNKDYHAKTYFSRIVNKSDQTQKVDHEETNFRRTSSRGKKKSFARIIFLFPICENKLFSTWIHAWNQKLSCKWFFHMFHFSQLRFTYEKKTTEKKFRIFFTFTRFPDGKKEGHEKDYAGKTQFPFSCQVRNAGKKTIYLELELVNRSPG